MNGSIPKNIVTKTSDGVILKRDYTYGEDFQGYEFDNFFNLLFQKEKNSS